MPDAIAWVDEVAPDEAVRICGAKMGRLAELLQAGVSLPKGFTVTVGAFRRHWDEAGLDEVADAAFGGLGAEAGPAEIEAYTVMHERDGSPGVALVGCLLDDRRRAWASSTDAGVLAAMTGSECVGRRARLSADGHVELA